MYTKTNWSDRVVENPSTYTMRNNSDETITLIPAPGTVRNSGTPIKAEYLNNMEKGIEEAHQSIENFISGAQSVAKSDDAQQINGIKIVKCTMAHWNGLNASERANTFFIIVG